MVVLGNNHTADGVLLRRLCVIGDDHGTVCVRAAGCTDGVHKRLEQLVDDIIGFLGSAGPLLGRADDTGFVHALEDQTVVIVLEGGTDLFPDGGQRSLVAFQLIFGGDEPERIVVVYIQNNIQPVVIGIVYDFLDTAHPRRINGAVC